MSERWGFDLSMEAVRLMRHDLGEWREFAVQALDGDDIEAQLAKLVAKADAASAVDIFLPRDQILYTDVKITDDTTAQAEINAAMEGSTPYALADLEVDWVMTAPGTARVAAIARKTLLEAESFVTQGGLTVRGFSSLADPDDFPRPPVFGALAEAPPVIETPAALPAFSTARKTSAPRPASDASAPVVASSNAGPVVKVDDPTPVMQLPKSNLPPLNPGAPLPRPTSQPRVVTNVGASAAEARAASLTAKPSVSIRPRDRAVPTLTLAAIAAALSIGIAIIIWSIVPTTPDAELVTPDTGKTAPTPAPETAAIAAPTPTPTPAEIAPETPGVSPLPTDVALVSGPLEPPVLPETTVALAWPASLTPVTISTPTSPANARTLAPDLSPAIAWLEARPDALETIENYTPVALTADDLAASDPFDTSVLTTLAPVANGERVASLIAPPDASVALRPAIETDAPALYVAPVLAEETAPEALPEMAEPDVELAALDPIIDDLAPAPEELLPEETATPEPAPPTLEETSIAETPALPTTLALIPTELAAALPDTAPRRRPGAFVAEIERQKYGGRTASELSEIRPGTRPQSAQLEALEARAGTPPSDLAVATSIPPRTKPADFDAIVANGLLQLRAAREARALAAATPDTSGAVQAALADEIAAEEATRPQNSPRLAIPSSASVARQATIEEAIRLNRINLVGVFGSPSARRALIRLPSGRYIKVQVGDKVDGGTVAGISDSTLQYQKGGRTVSLALPQG